MTTHHSALFSRLTRSNWFASGIVAFAIFLSAYDARAQTSTWISSTGGWNIPANWQSGLVPNASRDAFVNNGGTANVTFTGAALAKSLTLGAEASQSGTVQVLAGNSLTTGTSINVGVGGTGTFSVSGGADVRSGDVILGSLAGSVGNATVTGAGSRLDSDGFVNVGVGGLGILQIENEAVATAFAFRIGANSQSNGSVTVSGVGTELRQQVIVVGENGSATTRRSRRTGRYPF